MGIGYWVLGKLVYGYWVIWYMGIWVNWYMGIGYMGNREKTR